MRTLLQTLEEMQNKATPSEEGATEPNPWKTDMFAHMNLEQVGTLIKFQKQVHIIQVETSKKNKSETKC